VHAGLVFRDQQRSNPDSARNVKHGDAPLCGPRELSLPSFNLSRMRGHTLIGFTV
jgi:hypothetical protein